MNGIETKKLASPHWVYLLFERSAPQQDLYTLIGS